MTEPEISKKLVRERQLAFELLKKQTRQGDQIVVDTRNKVRQKFNISDLFDDNTQEIQTTPSKPLFQVDEISARSTDFATTSNIRDILKSQTIPDVDELLATSLCKEVNQMSQNFNRISNLPRTADISNSSSISTDWSAKGYNSDWLQEKLNITKDFEEEFANGGKNFSDIVRDQCDWEREYAVIPQTTMNEQHDIFKLPKCSNKASSKLKENLRSHVNLDDFSGYLEVAEETNRAFEESRRNLSIGQFFITKSEQIRDIIPNKSPPKRKGVPLVDTSSEISWLKETNPPMFSDEDKENTMSPNYEALDPENLSMKTILKALKTVTLTDDPKTIINKFIEAKMEKTANVNGQTQTILSNNTLEDKTSGLRSKIRNESQNNDRFLECSDSLSASESNNFTLMTNQMTENLKNVHSELHLKNDLPLNTHSEMNCNIPKDANAKIQEEFVSSPRTIVSSLERTIQNDRIFLVNTPSPIKSTVVIPGKLSLPAYPMQASCLTRTISQASSTSEFIANDRNTPFPLKSSCNELFFECVKLRECAERELTIKNNSDKRVPVFISITGPGFQLKEHFDGVLKLKPRECRTFVVCFCPTVIGQALGEIKFTLCRDLDLERVVYLYGYGGKSKIKVHGLQIPPDGIKYLTIGKSNDLTHKMEQYIQIGNRGDIDAFAIIAAGSDSKVFNKNFYPTSIIIQPQRVKLKPRGAISVKITYIPNRAETKYILNTPEEVVTITNISIITGDWPTRGRLKSAMEKCGNQQAEISSNNGLQNIISSEMGKESNEVVYKFIDDPLDAVKQCTDTFEHIEFALTINNSSDDSINLTPEDEQSLLFKTMLPRELKDYQDDIPFSVEPKYLNIEIGTTKSLFIRSESSKDEKFEIHTDTHALMVTPNTGILPAGSTTQLMVELVSTDLLNNACIEIYAGYGKLSIPITLNR